MGDIVWTLTSCMILSFKQYMYQNIRCRHALKCIRARHVTFFFLVDGSIRSAMGGQPFRIAMAGCSNFPACVVKCEYRFMTGKIDMPEAFHTLGRRSPESCRARSKADC
jgi:hypothetical protein